jgi:hypothetical protein
VDDIAGPIFGRHLHQILFPMLFPDRVTLIEHDRATLGKRRRGCVCADARGTIAVVKDSAIPKQMIFTERFM